MTIYATPFKLSTLETTGPSVDSGFQSLREVIKTLGNPDQPSRSHGVLIYGKNDNRVLYSRLAWRIDQPVNYDKVVI